MKPFVTSIALLACLLIGTSRAEAQEPSWKDVKIAVEQENFTQLQTWVRRHGVKHEKAHHALVLAAYHGNLGLIEKLLDWGVPVSGTNDNGVTALLKAAENGKTETVQYLLRRGADARHVCYCSETDCKGHTPIMQAACRKDLDMARALLKAGANPRAGDDWATEVADQNGDLALYLLLREHGGRERQTKSPPVVPEGAIPIGSLGLTELLPARIQEGGGANNRTRIRLSIIADDPNTAAADLVVANLSGEPSFELIERQELDKILEEKKLTRHFAITPANYGRVAELLRADALLLIQGRQVAGRKVVESRFLRVNPGLILDTVYSEAPLSNTAEWAKQMGARTRTLITKVTQPGAIALSLLNIQSSINSLAERGLDRTVAVMLSDRLAHQPHFVVLERAAMNQMAAEGGGTFWTGSYLVDGNIDPALNGSGAFSLSVRFRPTEQGETLTFTAAGHRRNPGQVLDDLIGQINARLARSSPPARRDLKDEAQHYLDEAHWALATDQAGLAQNSAEASWALGARSLELAKLRVVTALRALRDAQNQKEGKTDNLGPAGCIDLALHALSVWRETLESDLVRGRPEETRQWLEYGFEALDGALIVGPQLKSAASQVRHGDRLKRFRETVWETLETIRKSAMELSTGGLLVNRAAEKQAATARFVFRSASELLPVVRELSSRQFATNNVLTRARLRANLVYSWDATGIPPYYTGATYGALAFPQSRSDDQCSQLARMFQESIAPEDRYISAVLAMKVAISRGAVTQVEIDRLCSSLLGIDDYLAEGGELFGLYFGFFDSLDKCKGVPFFAMKVYEEGNRMWERHTPEHTRFRGQLFLRIAPKVKRPDVQFTRMLNRDDFTPEQGKEVAAARTSLEALTPPAKPPKPRHPGPARPPIISAEGQPPLHVRRLWHPFNLGLNIAPEFTLSQALQWIEERLWIHGYTVNRGGQPDRHFIFVVHPETLHTETLELPGNWATPSATFVVTKPHVLVTQPGRFAVFNRTESQWDTYPEINPGEREVPLLLGDNVYLSVLESPGRALIRFDLKSRTTEILTSARRRPAISPFDDVNLPITAVATNELGEVIVSSGKTMHAWLPAERTWRPYQPPPPAQTAAATTRGGYGRVGTVIANNDGQILRLNRKNGTIMDISLAYQGPAPGMLPESRYYQRSRYGQNIWPAHANSFAGGLLLMPGFHPSGLWIVPQQEIEGYLRLRDGSPKPLESVAK